MVPADPVVVPAGGGRQGATAPVRLSVQDLRVSLGSAAGPDVVADVSFQVGAGEVLGLVGESGSGKTTVALALLGHARRGLAIASGQVLLDDLDVLALGPRELQAVRGTKVTYVPQDPTAALNPALRIKTQLTEVLREQAGEGEVEARLTELLEMVHLPSTAAYLRRYPHQLSGGQQQRVAIAMAFACRPSLIVLDEPTTGLDVSTQRHILDTVTELTSLHGCAAVYVSHDLAVVGQLVSSVAVMYAGRIVELGQTGKVFSDPVHPYTRRLLAAVPSPVRAEVLQGIEGYPPRPGTRPAGCFFAARCQQADQECREITPEPVLVDERVVRCLQAGQPRLALAERPAHIAAPPAGAAPRITVSDLTASYGSTQVLHDVSLTVEADSCLAVVGESGSGKTTLARCLIGLHPGFTGSLTFDGASLPNAARRRPKDAVRRMQYIFQNPYTALNPRKTIEQNISLPLGHFFQFSRRQRLERVEQVLADVSLQPSYLARYPDELSGGERQRVAIARALAVEPEVLICDEITSALDVSVQAVIVELLRRLQRERHLALLFITHNISLVRSVAQSVAVLASGQLVEFGPVNEVLDHPRDAYTAQLMSDVPSLDRPSPPETGGENS
jgi:peptide/nickel transport system ATP-binding protein